MEAHKHHAVMVHTISVRQYGGTYIATIRGTGCRATCTMGGEQAAKAAVKKFLGDGPHSLERVTQTTELETWLLKDLRKVPSSEESKAVVRLLPMDLSTLPPFQFIGLAAEVEAEKRRRGFK